MATLCLRCLGVVEREITIWMGWLGGHCGEGVVHGERGLVCGPQNIFEGGVFKF